MTKKKGSKKAPVLVVTIKDGVVDEAKLFTDVKRAEECFILECLDKGARKDMMDDCLNSGYYQDSGTDRTVCITHPTIL